MTASGIGKEPPFSKRATALKNKNDIVSSPSQHENSSERVVLPPEEQNARKAEREGRDGTIDEMTTDLCTVQIDYKYWSYRSMRPGSDIQAFLKRDLNVSRLNNAYDLLWWAGRQVPTRPLHRLKMLGRNLTVTEQADLHLVWSSECFYVKPLPDFLLDHSFWEQHICGDEHSQDVYESARGFILSYVWLVRHKSDFKIAQDEWLLPPDLTWASWREFVESVWDYFGDLDDPHSISKRYRYGELRLGRLDQIFRFAPRYFPRHLLQGYLYLYTSYGTFFRREFAWLVVAFAYVSIILSAMQVGLSTTELGDNRAFDRASYGFTVASIFLPVIALVIALALYTTLWLYHVLLTRISAWRGERIRQKYEGQ